LRSVARRRCADFELFELSAILSALLAPALRAHLEIERTKRPADFPTLPHCGIFAGDFSMNSSIRYDYGDFGRAAVSSNLVEIGKAAWATR